MNGFVLKGSKSSMCSPVPMKVMGLFVAATLEGFTRVLTTNEEREREKDYVRAESSTTFGMTVEFSDDHWADIDFWFECFRLDEETDHP